MASDDREFTFPIGPCVGCGCEEYTYTEVGMFPARKCEGCGAQVMHHRLGPSAPDLEDDHER